MQELAFLLTGLAGAASAVAFAKFPKNTHSLKIIGANPRIQREIAYMEVERDILVKTVSRLYQQDSKIDGEKRGKLLSKYQHQLGIVLARIEKLEIASKHPDMGPVGDGLVTLMDQKLSTLDEKLHEISSKISATSAQIETYEKPSRKESNPNRAFKFPKYLIFDSRKFPNQKTCASAWKLPPSLRLQKDPSLLMGNLKSIPQTTLQHSEPKTEYRPVDTKTKHPRIRARIGCRGEYSGSDTGLGMFGLGVSITGLYSVFGSECCNVVCGILTLDFDRSKDWDPFASGVRVVISTRSRMFSGWEIFCCRILGILET